MSNKVSVQQHLELLGYRVRDKVTQFEGTVTSVSFDLYGCVQLIINPGLDKDGKPQESQWFDAKRIETTSNAPVIPVPIFADIPKGSEQGPAEKPRQPAMPVR